MTIWLLYSFFHFGTEGIINPYRDVNKIYVAALNNNKQAKQLAKVRVYIDLYD